jgi:hypothetical protein
MITQYTEVYSTEEFQYLLIHKNGCTSVMDSITTRYPEFCYSPQSIKPSQSVVWAVYRDPIDRFVASVAYDLKENDIEITETNVLEFVGSVKTYIYGKTNVSPSISHVDLYKGVHKMRHSLSQTMYLFDNNVDILVRMEDLGKFLFMHFGTPLHQVRNQGDTKDKGRVLEILRANRPLLELVKAYLAADYYTFESFIGADRVWTWGNGRIF